MKNIPPIYVTGNINKAQKLKNLLGLNIDHHSLDLDEIQSNDMRAVVEHKVRQAYEILKRPVLVEDTCL
ncbi:non-canonical purine NTP pyrophosphatase, partial [Candidatus Saccharibacteria bacterium]|nr:non-canonical purine NTP pyrophosphatase [Candidatus Saccharibacteria bacterium]